MFIYHPKVVKIMEDMKKDHWFVLGALISDGHVSTKNHKLSFGQSENHKMFFYETKKAFEKIERLNLKTYTIEPKQVIIRGRKCDAQRVLRFSVGRIPIIRWWEDHIKQFRKGKIYPEIRQHKIAFIRGYWQGDGSMTICNNIGGGGHKATIGFHDGSLETLKAVVKIMADLGWERHHKISDPNKNKKYFILRYNIDLDEFVRTIKPVVKINPKFYDYISKSEAWYKENVLGLPDNNY